ncbi:2-dehydropantoate 2-reductase [Priestia megaterium]
MRILVLGAGGVGGYFGGRLVEKGEDVTFLVRERRKKELEQNRLVIKSAHGDFTSPVQAITKSEVKGPYDVILFTTKAYHLTQAIEDVRPFVGNQTVVIPLLNGMAHVAPLQEAFGEEKVIGGLCFIETTLNQDGEVVQTSPAHRLVFGEFKQKDTERLQLIEQAFSGTKASFVKSSYIEQDMWHKYLFITVMSGMTTLMRAPVGPVLAAKGGRQFVQELFKEVENIMMAYDAPLAEGIIEQHMNTMDKMTYDMKSSMQRDMEKSSQIEGDHLQGYLLKLAEKSSIHVPLLQTVHTHLKVYEEMLKGYQK